MAKKYSSAAADDGAVDHADEAAGDTSDSNANFNEYDDTTSNEGRASVSATSGKSRPSKRTKKSAAAVLRNRLQQPPSLRRSVSYSSFERPVRDLRRHSSRSIRVLKRQSSSIIEGIHRSLPASPTGWALLALASASAGLQYELRLQRELTSPPLVFCQNSMGGDGGALNRRMDRVLDKLSGKNGDDGGVGEGGEGIFSRKVIPSLFIGTRGIVSSAAAYALGDGSSNRRVKRVREVMKMGSDAALIVLDWEIPLSKNKGGHDLLQVQPPDITKANSIERPVVLLLHGMNNDSSFGYIRSMMRTATEREWIAVCMNFRGQDGAHKVKNTTPRGYNAGYTGDLRGVVQQIEHRLKKTEQRGNGEGDGYVGGPIFILGYSLGANVVTKYLGEESLHGTLPRCIGGGATMGNPLYIHSPTIKFPWNMLLGAGVKRSILQNFQSFKGHHDPGFQRAMKKAMLSPTIGKLDDAAAPYLIRNDPHPPYTPRIGFRDGEDYWWDSSSHRYVMHISVPLLKISAQDDFLVFGQFAKKLNRCLENPNVVVVKTRCGGHLGWQESPPPSRRGGKPSGGSGSWSDVAVADFIEALLQIQEEDRWRGTRKEKKNAGPTPPLPKIMSRL